MMYFVFMKNFLLTDSGVQMPVRLISASWAQKKPFYSYLVDTMYVEFMKIFFSPTAARRYLLDSFRPMSPKTFDSYFLDMMYFEFMKNFLLADSGEQMPVRLISASWAKKRLIPTFWKWCTSCSWKIFFSPIRACRCLLDSFRPPEPKNVWFLLSRYDLLRVLEKFSSRWFRGAEAC